jgi:ketosteroid isomerase-like protein
MNLKDPIITVRAFNDCINLRDIDGLASLMSEDHTFIDRDGSAHGPKSHMVAGWKQFFEMFPVYKNTFNQIRADGDRVFVLGFAYWSEKEPYDPVIWSATVKDDLIAEWQIYVDSADNRKKFNFS